MGFPVIETIYATNLKGKKMVIFGLDNYHKEKQLIPLRSNVICFHSYQKAYNFKAMIQISPSKPRHTRSGLAFKTNFQTIFSYPSKKNYYFFVFQISYHTTAT